MGFEMISGDFTHCLTLEQFYKEIRQLQSKAHGEDYADVHQEIVFHLRHKGPCSYRELGVNQGATAAIAMHVSNHVRIYDINLSNFEPYRHLFEEFAKLNNINFRAEQKSSLDTSTVEPVDVLYIDTLHQREHLLKELDLHSSSVRKSIICHDTQAKYEMFRGIEEWISRNPAWKIHYHHPKNVGYTTLVRK